MSRCRRHRRAQINCATALAAAAKNVERRKWGREPCDCGDRAPLAARDGWSRNAGGGGDGGGQRRGSRSRLNHTGGGSHPKGQATRSNCVRSASRIHAAAATAATIAAACSLSFVAARACNRWMCCALASGDRWRQQRCVLQKGSRKLALACACSLQ